MRRAFMWIAVASLTALAATSVASTLAARSLQGNPGGGGWTFYTPYSQRTEPLAMQVIEACGHAESFLYPVAFLSSAAFMLLLDRDLRRGAASRGFQVASTPSAPPPLPPLPPPPLIRQE